MLIENTSFSKLKAGSNNLVLFIIQKLLLCKLAKISMCRQTQELIQVKYLDMVRTLTWETMKGTNIFEYT